MAAPTFATNTTIDIYQGMNIPPAAPDVAGVPVSLRPEYQPGLEASEGAAAARWTHIIDVALGVDIRDAGGGGPGGSSVYVPDKNGTKFNVVWVERVGRGSAGDHKRAYLLRTVPAWPTDEV